MSTALLAGASLVLVAISFALLLLLRPHRGRAIRIGGAPPNARELRRRTSTARLLGVLAGAGAALACAALDPGSGRLAAIAPLAGAGTAVLALTCGDLLILGSARTGHADPTRREAGLPPLPPLARWILGATVALLVVLALGALTASPDDLGRAGRALTLGSADGESAASGTPWPGAYYGLPIVAGLLTLFALTAAGLAVSGGRPRGSADPGLARVDDWVRRRQSESLVAAAGGGIAAELGGVLAAMGIVLHGLAGTSTDPGPSAGTPGASVGALGMWSGPAVWLALAGALGAAALAIACLALLLAPGAWAGRGRRSASALAEPEGWAA